MGIRFKIANWIMGDRLRNYLAVGVRLPLVNASTLLERDAISQYAKDEIRKAIATIDELFEI